METQELLKRLARLETREDHLVAEITHLNNLLTKVGFQNGIATLKAAAEAMIDYPELGFHPFGE